MRFILNTLLVVLLIAAFAVGTPIPAQASCQDSSDCNLVKAGLADGSCDQKGEPCKIAQNCASPLQKMPAFSAIRVLPDVAQTQYGPLSSDAIASAFVLPETAPPRA